jgi:LAO/AO transport system kinase
MRNGFVPQRSSELGLAGRTSHVVELLRQGDRRTLARLLTAAENDDESIPTLLETCRSIESRAHSIGITGAPGVGKSTLVAALVRYCRGAGKKVAVLAIDPSSPFTGGALLGDRVRMTGAPDNQVFYRSAASREGAGGITQSTGRLLRLLDLAGYDVILLETVGAGQSEVAVAQFAQTVLVVLAPGMGDDIQINKAGILEIGNVFVVNKADQPGAEQVKRSLRAMAKLMEETDGWKPAVKETSAVSGEGVAGLLDTLERHRIHIQQHARGGRPRRQWVESQLSQSLASLLLASLRRDSPEWWSETVSELLDRRLDPLTAAQRVLGSLTGNAEAAPDDSRGDAAQE